MLSANGCRPCLQGRAPLREIVVSVVRALDAAQLMPEAPFSDFAPDAQRREVRPHRPSEIVRVKCETPCQPRQERRSMCRCRRAEFVDAGRADASGRRTARDEAQRLQPLNHFRDQGNGQRFTGLRAIAGQAPDRTRVRATFEIKFLPGRFEQLALANAEGEKQLDRRKILAPKGRCLAQCFEPSSNSARLSARRRFRSGPPASCWSKSATGLDASRCRRTPNRNTRRMNRSKSLAAVGARLLTFASKRVGPPTILGIVPGSE
jgi:hypothetical protein